VVNHEGLEGHAAEFLQIGIDSIPPPPLDYKMRENRPQEKERAARMAVFSIIDVQPRAQAALANSPFHELRDLNVKEQGTALEISGVVSSFYHKQLAQEVVRCVCRDIEIVNAIRVEDGFGI
jgi:hypothetical protein